MKARHALPAALVAAVTLTSVAAAGPDAAKQRVVLTSQTSQTSQASPTAAGSSLPAGTTSSKLAFISHRRSACCGPGPPFELNVMNADGSGKRLLTRDVWQGLAWSPDGQKFAFVGGRDRRRLRHQRRRQRATEADTQRGKPLRSCLVARRAEDRLRPGRRASQRTDLHHERGRERTAEADAPRGGTTRIRPGCPTGRSPS